MALINKLKAIADAIRSKTGKTDAISLDDMAVEVAAIEASGGGTDLMLAGGLAEITNDHVTTLRDYALYMHTKDLVSVHFPNVTSIGSYSLGSCNVLTEASMPKLLTVGSSSFNCCFFFSMMPDKQSSSATIFSCSAIGGTGILMFSRFFLLILFLVVPVV